MRHTPLAFVEAKSLVFVVCLIVIRDFHSPLQRGIAGYVSTKLMKHIFYILVNFIKVGDLHFFFTIFTLAIEPLDSSSIVHEKKNEKKNVYI
jgi:hypothetical protein